MQFYTYRFLFNALIAKRCKNCKVMEADESLGTIHKYQVYKYMKLYELFYDVVECLKVVCG